MSYTTSPYSSDKPAVSYECSKDAPAILIGNNRLSPQDRELCEQFERALKEKDYSSQQNCFFNLSHRKEGEIDRILGNCDFSDNLDAVLDLAKCVCDFIEKKCDELCIFDDSKVPESVKIVIPVTSSKDSGLCLRVQAFSVKDAAVLFKIFEKAVKCLDICVLDLQKIPTFDGVESNICRLLQSSRIKIKSLTLRESGITNPLFSVLAPVLTELEIERLFLENNKLTKNAHTAQLLCNSCLKSLSLFNNPLGTKEVVQIAGALKGNTSLEWLELSGVSMDTEGFVHLAKALESNTSLKTLLLRNNKLDNNITPAVQILLNTKSLALEYLDIADNNLDTLGLKRIYQMFERIKPPHFSLNCTGGSFFPSAMSIEWKRVAELLKEKNSQAQSL